MAIYKLIKDWEGTEVGVNKDCGTYSLSIPFSQGNTDYAEYKAWVDSGNTPEEAAD